MSLRSRQKKEESLMTPVEHTRITRRKFLGGVAAITALGTGTGLVSQRHARAQNLAPNIVLIISDDQPKRRTWTRAKLSKLFARMIDGGIDYEFGFAATPLCTPTRWSMISGRWQHTHGVTANTENGYSAGKSKGLLNDTPATRLKSLGYRVGFFGKFQNGYFKTPTDLPPGYDKTAWFVHANKIDSTEPSHTFNEFGTVRTFSQPPHYSSELITSRVQSFLVGQASRPEPFFITASYLSPHNPYFPDPAHEHDWDAYPLEEWPNMAAMSASERTAQRAVQEGKLEEMEEVDDAVEHIYAALETTGQLANTYVIYIADNGYLLGEHDQYQKDKWWHESVSTPFAITGPGVAAGVKSYALVSHIDIPTTICDLAGAPWSDWDGRSLVPTFSGVPAGWRSKLLIESRGPGWAMVRTSEYAYIHKGGKTNPYMLFDVAGDDADPYELTNIYSTTEGQQVRAELQPALDALRVCSGSSCRTAEM
jgi:N-acetylglucosamine-6-sulfatase